MAPRFELRGILAAPDDFGRLRVFLPEDAPGTVAAEILRRAPGPNGPLEPRGEYFVVTLPARRRDHWLAVAARLQRCLVRLAVTARPWRCGGRSGTALDLFEIIE